MQQERLQQERQERERQERLQQERELERLQQERERERLMKEQQINAMLTTLQCTPATREKIRNYLDSVGLTKLADLSANQMIALLEIVKPKDQGCD